MENTTYRLVTRSDFDGLVCAALLRELGLVDEIAFAHPKDMQDGKVQVSDRDITANLPYVAGVHLAFDHHASEALRVGQREGLINDPKAPSAARVVYEHFGGAKAFPGISPDLMRAVDRGDSAQFDREEILAPRGWALLNYLLDARTGLGRFREFRISNLQLMNQLPDLLRRHTVEEILETPDVQDRVELYREHEPLHKEQMLRIGKVHGNLVVFDLRGEETIYAGNRFVVYALFPDQNISVHAVWGRQKQNVAFAVGKSILARTSKTNVGALCLDHGGGGHEAAGTCQVAPEDADRVLGELIARITRDG